MEQSERHWLYALSAPMVAINHPSASYTAPDFYTEYSRVNLSGSWGIESREDLLDTAIRTADHGHASRLWLAYWQRSQALPSRWRALLDTLSPYDRVLYEYADQTIGECGFGGIRAWDIGRTSYLLRCGVKNEWINEDESLWLHSRLAPRARHYYQSRKQYTSGFICGRAFWQCLGHEDPDMQRRHLARQGEHTGNREIVSLLTQSSFDPPWHQDLVDAPEKPDSLKELNWS